MSTAAHAGPAVSPREASSILGRHLLCFVLPVTTLGFFLTAPHPWFVSLLWITPLVVSVLVDDRAGAATLQPAPTLPGWPFDGVLYALVGLQLVNLALAMRYAAANPFFSVDMLIGWQLLGITAGYSGIVVAHELIHRRAPRQRLLGRALLCTVLYEHFATEHLRGHHVRVGTGDDPATARFGERYQAFFRRTVPAQFRSAWRIEARRLGDENMRWWDPRMAKSAVVHGLVVGWGLAFAVLAVFGAGAFALYLAQAFLAVRLLEVVNFFEHWGLERRGPRVSPVDSWDTSSWFTLYTLVGLSRHADHHAFAARPYQQLRHWEESPKLPRGYFGMVVLAFAQPRKFETLMTEELRRRGLGPFAGEGAVAGFSG